MFASIPSPSSGTISIGPLTLTAYGLMIAVGVLAAVELARRRWRARGGAEDDISTIAIWAVPAGLLGARAYHVLTDWKRFEGRWGDVYKIWEGGLGIPGGMAVGILTGIWVARRKGLPVAGLLDAAVPGLPLAQAIGRWGNWWNQELFGGPTDLPWGLEIDPDHRPAGYAGLATFHPTFLYEGLWNLALMALMLWLDRRKVLRPGHLIGVYLAGYGLGRLWVEALRIDDASLVVGVRVNIWMSLALIAGGAWIILRGRKHGPGPIDLSADPVDAADPTDDADVEVEGRAAAAVTSDAEPNDSED